MINIYEEWVSKFLAIFNKIIKVKLFNILSINNRTKKKSHFSISNLIQINLNLNRNAMVPMVFYFKV